MKNNAPGGDGNDLAMDDITFRPCGKLITANVIGNANDTIHVCEGNTSIYNFNATVSAGYLSPVYQWQLSTNLGTSWTDIAGADKISYQRQPTGAGNYWYRFTVVEANAAGSTTCRIASNAVVVNVHAKPTVDAGPDRNVLTGNSVTLNGNVAGDNLLYSWSPNIYIDDIKKLKPVVSPLQDISYTLSASSVYGCSNNDQVLVKVVTGIYIPSAFTPNGDGKNDTWKIPFLDPDYHATVQVFNRFGQKVYEAVGAVISWDGKLQNELQPSGAYVYFITFKESKLKLRGTVSIIR
jgi:gliding motility-associated-like protein